MAKDENPVKKLSLKTHEINLLNFTREHSEAIFSGILSTIALDRLGYPVTNRTKFSLSADLSEMSLEELPEVKEESPVKTAK